MKQLIAVETLRAQPGKMSALRDVLLELTPTVLKEKGCLQYEIAEPDVHEEIILVLMRWETMADIEAHEASEPVQDFVRKYDGILYGEVQQTLWWTC